MVAVVVGVAAPIAADCWAIYDWPDVDSVPDSSTVFVSSTGRLLV